MLYARRGLIRALGASKKRSEIMKLLISAFILMSVYSCHYGQKPTESKCKLQELAIHAALGDADAQYDLGVEFHRGVDIAQDYSKAAVMWRLASNGGVIPAFNNLGYLTYYGKGVKQDYAEGVRLWRVAAVQRASRKHRFTLQMLIPMAGI